MSTQTQDDQLAKLIEAVLASSKYKDISDDLVREIGGREIIRHSNLKEAIKATKGKLHQIGGAFLAEKKDYALWLATLEQLLLTDNRANVQAYLKTIMPYHASTRERLPLLDQFYQTIFADLPPIHSILDIACGFHPLTLPWMPLSGPVEYYACDIYKDITAFLAAFLTLMQVQGQTFACDVTQACPPHRVDVAFVLKALPCLEQLDKAAGLKLLHALNASYIVVSFPVHSLGGKAKGMAANYEAHLYSLLETTGWSVKRFTFASELAFLIQK